MSSESKQLRMTRDRLVRCDGMALGSRVGLVILCSVVVCVAYFIFRGIISRYSFYPVLEGLITGVVVGLFPVGLVMGIVVIRVRIVNTLCWCFLSALLGVVVGWILLGEDYATWTGILALCLAAVVLMFVGPRYVVYSYARCPGCKYNLALLPKSDVCPECGRDNRDLVEVFKDLDIAT